jgi:hypothetical protein
MEAGNIAIKVPLLSEWGRSLTQNTGMTTCLCVYAFDFPNINI